MTEIYSEIMGNKKYCVFEYNSDNIKMYNITVFDNNNEYTVNNFTSDRNKAVEFAESLVRNYVSGIHIHDIAYDFIS